MLIDALDDKAHICDEWCSDFICYKYEATSCKTWYCENLFLKEKRILNTVHNVAVWLISNLNYYNMYQNYF